MADGKNASKEKIVGQDIENNVENKCQYCGEELPETATVNVMLFDVFGYMYCSEECLQAHLEEK